MSIKFSEVVDDLTSKPLQDKDIILFSNTTDGGTTFDVSKKGFVDQLAAYIISGGTPIPVDIVVKGTGTGIEASNAKIGDDGDPADMFLGHKNVTSNRFEAALSQGEDGNTKLNSKLGQSLVIAINNDQKILCSATGTQVAALSGQLFTVGLAVGGGIAGTKTEIRGLGNTSATSGFIVTNSDGGEPNLTIKCRDDGQVFLRNGTGVNEISTDSDFSGATDDQLKTGLAIKDFVEASGGGWFGSQTRIKIAPWDIVSYNDKDGVSIQNNGGIVNDAAAKITTMVTGVFIPTGYRATAFMINASANIAIELFESQIDDSTEVSKGSGNANTEVNITNVDSTTTNYLSIIIVEAGNDIYGGYITIEKI